MEIEEYRGYEIEIRQDEDCESPRDWDNLGTMVCFHNRYDLGDKHNMTVEEAKDMMKHNNVFSLPLYLYDHSGLTINTTGFSCPWDSGQVGFIYVTKEQVRKEYSVKRISKQLKTHVLDYLRGEVETYDKYLRGDVYGYSIDKEYDLGDSCWGFYGYDCCLQEAKSIIDWHLEQKTKNILLRQFSL